MEIFTKNRNKIITAFKTIYILLALFVIWRALPVFTNQKYNFELVSLGIQLGHAAVVTYILTLIPGIARRFKWKHKFFNILMLYRRHLGILTYLLVFIHLNLVFFLQNIALNMNLTPTRIFVIFGVVAHLGLIPMFLTSNDWSVKKLGKLWGRVHKITYIVAWFIFAHVALQGLSIWSILIGTAAILEISSLYYKYILQKKPPRETVSNNKKTSDN